MLSVGRQAWVLEHGISIDHARGERPCQHVQDDMDASSFTGFKNRTSLTIEEHGDVLKLRPFGMASSVQYRPFGATAAHRTPNE